MMAAIRTAVLLDERGHRLGVCQVPETAPLIEYDGRLFIRNGEGLRLSGGGIGVSFIEVEPLVRPSLRPI